MMISTRGRYALRVMIDLAEHRECGYIPMKEVAKRQDISLKYLERILPMLVKNEFVEGIHGKGGGYKLVCDPKECTVGEILRVTEGDLAPVSCLSCKTEPCQNASSCKIISMWNEFYHITNQYFDGITISDLISESDNMNTINERKE